MVTDLKECFKRDGFVMLPHVLPADLVAEMRAVTDRVVGAGLDRADGDPHYDFEPVPAGAARAVQRVKRPHEIDPFYDRLARSPILVDLVETLIGPDIRLHHSKINVKEPSVGSPLEWHQDWAFVPHTNAELVFISIAVDACTAENGPLQLIPGSHRGGLLDHHHDGVFFGALDVETQRVATETAVSLVGPPGTLSLHHPLMIHGSGHNRSQASRRMLFFEYAAADAWPLFYGVDYDEFDRRMVRGRSCNTPRLASVPVKMPYPRASAGMIYALQQRFAKKYFAA